MVDEKKRGAFASLSSLFGASKKEEKSNLVRPPYNKEKHLFGEICLTCKDAPCVKACEEEIIGLDEGNIPYLLFSKSGCTFCEECARACPHGVLHVENPAKIKAHFSIDVGGCLAWNSTICNSCADVCNEKAIEFFGMFRPQIAKDKCTSCGFCYGVCPTKAVIFKEVT